MKEIDNIQDYYNIAKTSETITRFHKLLRCLAFRTDEFTKEKAEELLYIVDNEQENIKLMAETFRKSGHMVEIIPDDNWDYLRSKILLFL